MKAQRTQTELLELGSFKPEHQRIKDEVMDALQLSGETLILAGRQPTLVSLYLQQILGQIEKRKGAEAAPLVRRLPADREAIVNGLNARLAEMNVAEITASGNDLPSLTKEIWIYESLSASKGEAVCFAARMLRQLKKAGVSLVVLVVPGESNTQAVRDLMHGCRAKRWDLSTPSEIECSSYYAKAKLLGQTQTIRQIFREAGFPLPELRAPEVLDLQARISRAKVEQSVSSKNPLNDAPKSEVHQSVQGIVPVLDSELSVVPLHAAQAKTRLTDDPAEPLPQQGSQIFSKSNLIQVAVGCVLMAVVVVFQISGPLQLDALWAETETPAAAPLPAPVIAEPALVVATTEATTAEPARIASAAQLPEATAPDTVMASDTEEDLKALFATPVPAEPVQQPVAKIAVAEANTSTVLANDSTDIESLEPGLKTPDPLPGSISDSSALVAPTQVVAATPPVNSAFLQHAAFGRIEGALVWQASSGQTEGTKIFTKGTAPRRFVVVSGPYASLDVARSELASSTISGGAFVVSADQLGEEVVAMANR